MTACQTFVYGLIDPRTRLVFYVGQTRTGVSRPLSHFADRSNAAKTAIIDELRESGVFYEWAVLEEVANENSLLASEKWWIGYGAASGWPLCNQKTGRQPSADPTRPITVRLPESQIKSLRAIADKQGITLRQAIVESVETAIARGSTR